MGIETKPEYRNRFVAQIQPVIRIATGENPVAIFVWKKGGEI